MLDNLAQRAGQIDKLLRYGYICVVTLCLERHTEDSEVHLRKHRK
jgi:hypothetical protein